ncbi:bifunctional DNA primase/polymerase [Streptomyces chumphonensis]|uniref:Bifunctional DNA primase/polymerase n=1 Tax=Streptomyces chumphonensis TaxID=1214925 RepID=A0A927F181_9ACTN|nr:MULTISPECIES: bifunctional DNA primase/polymerase [Streptomyces]MBD3933140.1 bifunctional DNA primase/polymerase [Streptomyces chumphonensis]MBW1599755.1 bifunctional DNA primase/polymerase [Streptomyces sp. JJ38]
MTHDRKTVLLSAALDAAERGWPVHPLRPCGKRPALHGEKACTGQGICAGGHVKWEQRATTDPGRIERCWATAPFNVGIATGPAGLVVVDLDLPKDDSKTGTPCGVTNFRALCERAGQPVPATRTVRTARGGKHLYFRAPDRVQLRNTQDELAGNIDTRAWGGYVVAPGSNIPEGTYQLIDDTPVTELPAWLLDALTPAPPRPVRLAVARCGNRLADAVLERETAAVAATAEGGRNTQLLASARAVGRFVAWGDLPRHQVEEAFQGAGEAAGLAPQECRATIRSALNWSIRTARPRETA